MDVGSAGYEDQVDALVEAAFRIAEVLGLAARQADLVRVPLEPGVVEARAEQARVRRGAGVVSARAAVADDDHGQGRVKRSKHLEVLHRGWPRAGPTAMIRS
jgi:hypothetical protein